MKGTVKFYNEMKGFGFITPEEGEDVFVHSSGIKGGVTLHEGDSVTFDVEQGEKGPKASNVALAGSEGSEPSSEGGDKEAPTEQESPKGEDKEAPAEKEPSEDKEKPAA